MAKLVWARSTLLLCGLMLLAAACQSETTWERIEAAGVLKVGLDPTYPPFEAMNETEVYGLDVDLARAITADLGVEPEFLFFGYDGLYDALATGQVDVLISGMVIVPERTRDFAYSAPYFNAGEILITHVATTDIHEIEDVNGRLLAVELGAQGHVEATTWARRLPDLTIVPYPSPDEAAAAVAAGEADAALIDGINGRLYLQQEPQLRRIEPALTTEPYALVVRIEDEQLLTRLNDSLTTLQSSGQLAQIIHQWVGP